MNRTNALIDAVCAEVRRLNDAANEKAHKAHEADETSREAARTIAAYYNFAYKGGLNALAALLREAGHDMTPEPGSNMLFSTEKAEEFLDDWAKKKGAV